MSNYIPLDYVHVITYPYPNTDTVLGKRGFLVARQQRASVTQSFDDILIMWLNSHRYGRSYSRW